MTFSSTAPSFTLAQTQAPPIQSDAWHSLSLVRFFLALIVGAHHLAFFSPVELNVAMRALGSLGGHAAVISFLLISGFSIAHSIHHQPAGFVRRRVWRIYPIYLTGLIFALGVLVYTAESSTLMAKLQQNGGMFLAHAFMLQGVVSPVMPVNTPLWTLSLEWWLYMLAPLFLACTGKTMLRVVAVLVLGFLSWLFLWRYLGSYNRVLYGGNLLFMGVFWVLGFLFYFYRSLAWSNVALVLGVWMLTAINRESLDGNSQITLVLGCAGLIAGHWVPWPKKLVPLIKLLGEISFPLYILHMPFYKLAVESFHVTNGTVLLTSAVALALLAHLLIEKPLRSVGRKSPRTTKARTAV